MRIGIDARFYGPFGKGLGRYVQKLIENLGQIDKENEYIVFLRKENFDDFQPFNKNFHKVLADYAWYSFAEQLFFPILLRKYKLDLMHFPHFNVPILYFGKFIITIHDLILIHFPTVRGTTLNPLWYWVKFRAYRLAILSAILRSKAIITVSEFSKKDIIKEYPWAEKKIYLTYQASGEICFIPSQEPHKILEKYGIIKPYLLYVGNAYPHKNLETLVDAFEQILMHDSNIQLALVGKEDFFYARIKKMVFNKNLPNVHFLVGVDDQDLDVLYRYAEVYVFPSLYEGFGLPPLEAMAKGTPVVSSNHDCMREVLEDAAYFVDARNVNNLADGALKVMQDQNLRDRLIEKGYEQIKKYSWEKMARQTWEIYKN